MSSAAPSLRWRGWAAGALIAALPVLAPAAPPLPEPAEMARMIQGFLSYTRWPGAAAAPQLCLAMGPARAEALVEALRGLAGQDAPGMPAPAPMRAPLLLAPGDVPASGCDALVFEGWPEAAQRQALAQLRARPVLTVGIGEVFCSSGGGFCLLPPPHERGGWRFAANVDAHTRAGLRVNPRVLALAGGGRREGNPP